MLDQRRVRRVVLIILVISVAIRLIVALYYGNWVPSNQDDHSYSQLAWRLATGHGYSFSEPWYPFTPSNTPTSHWSFLYTAFVAGIYSITGYLPLAARLLGAVLSGLLLPWMVYRLSRQLYPERYILSVLGTACTAFYAYFILFAARLMTESFFVIGLLWSMLLAIKMARRLRNDTRALTMVALQLGLSLGITALFRQSILPWIPLLFIWLSLQVDSFSLFVSRALRPLMITGIVLMLCILPWTARNYAVYGDFLLLNSNTGYAMYSAQHPMQGTDFQEHEAAPLPSELLPMESMTESAWDRALMKRGLTFMAAEPQRYIRLSLSRILDLFEFWPTPNTPLLHNVGRLVSFTLYLPFMVYGSVLAIRRSLSDAQNLRSFLIQPTVLLLGFNLFYALLHILTWAMPRYRIPIDAVMMPVVALALRDLYHRGRSRLLLAKEAKHALLRK